MPVSFPESASRPLVCFGGLIDTTIKGLTILLSIWAGIDYHICYICDVMYQCSRQGSYDKMNAMTCSSMRILTSNGYHINWDMNQRRRIYSYIQIKVVDICGTQSDKSRYCEWDKGVCLGIVSHLEKLVIRKAWDIWRSSKCERNGFYYNSKINASSRGLLRINGWDRKASF